MAHNLTQIAESFLVLTAAGDVDFAYTKYLANDFLHHNQHFKGDRESLRLAMLDSAVKMPGKQLSVVNIMQQGEIVMAYSRVAIASKNMEFAAFHMFRFRENLIVELWDMAQVVDKTGPNKNGMF